MRGDEIPISGNREGRVRAVADAGDLEIELRSACGFSKREVT